MSIKTSTWSIGVSKQKRGRALMRTRWWKASHEEATQGYETWSSFIHNFAGSSPTTGINLVINWAPRIVEPQIPEVLKIIPPTEYFLQLITPSLQLSPTCFFSRILYFSTWDSKSSRSCSSSSNFDVVAAPRGVLNYLAHWLRVKIWVLRDWKLAVCRCMQKMLVEDE